MSEPEIPQASAAAPAADAPSPGRLLSQARARAGLGAEDLAGQLKLAKGTLEALERDDFAALSEPVYVRGYYRKIAKVLNIPEADLIAAYDARSAPTPSTHAMRRIPLAGGVAAGTSRQYKGQGIWIGIAVIVLAALGFALADRKPAERLAPAPVETPAAAPAPQSGPQTQPQPEATAIPTPSVQGAEPAGNPVATTPPAAAPAPEPAPEPAPLADAGPAATPGQLVLEFSEASFIRVEDTRGRTLAIGLVRGGERKALDGQPPYTVFLGNAQNVKVRFGGAPVDFSAHINAQNDTARFTVP